MVGDQSQTTNVLINGLADSTLSHSDRGFAYGHGVFETVRVCDSLPLLWEYHYKRLELGCKRLAIALPSDWERLLFDEIQILLTQAHGGGNAVIKVTITAGEGGRGYSQPENMRPTRLVARYASPTYPQHWYEQGVGVRTCDYKLPINPRLAGIKHLNRLDQVLARDEWSNPEIAEGILTDSQGQVIEGTATNLFGCRDGRLITPVLTHCGVQGVMRDYLCDLAQQNEIRVEQVSWPVDRFKQLPELFLCNSVAGIWPICRWDQQAFKVGDMTTALQAIIAPLFAANAKD